MPHPTGRLPVPRCRKIRCAALPTHFVLVKKRPGITLRQKCSHESARFMKNSRLRLAVLAAIALAACSAIAQTQMPAAGPPGWNAALTRLFGDIKAFTARAEMRALDKAGKEVATVPMGFAMLDDKVRLEIDMNQMKSAQMPPGMGAQLKQLGLDRTVVVMTAQKKSMLVIYPALQAYVDMPMPDEAAAAVDRNFKIEKTPLGKETVDGHACVKHRVILTDAKGQKAEAMVWNASDLKDFPVQMQMNDKEATVVMRYKEIQLAKPETKQFDPPAGFTRHADMQQLMMIVMQKQSGGQGRKK